MKVWVKVGVGYISTVAMYGFYRGYNNLFCNDKFETRTFLITDRVVNGIGGALWSLNPVYQPILIIGIIRRMEKKWRQIPLEKIDYYD